MVMRSSLSRNVLYVYTRFQCPSRISKLCLLRFALLGEIELMDGVGGHVPQDRAVAIASMAKTCGCARAFS
jgi:hypothetical protein